MRTSRRRPTPSTESRSSDSPLPIQNDNSADDGTALDDHSQRSLRDDRVPAVDHNGLPRDEVVVGDEADDGLRDVVGGRHTTERRAVGASVHQAVVVGAERGLHPPAFHPAGATALTRTFGARMRAKDIVMLTMA